MPPHTTALLILTHGDAVDPIPSAVQQSTSSLPTTRSEQAVTEADTKFRSSNTADSVLNVCDDCTANAFRNRDDYDFDIRYCPSSERIFAVHTPIIADRPSTDSGLEHGNMRRQF